VNFAPDDPPKLPTSADTLPAEGLASSPIHVGTAAPGCPAEQSPADASGQSGSASLFAAGYFPEGQYAEIVPAPLDDPSWSDVFVLVVLTVLSSIFLFGSLIAAVMSAKKWIYPHLVTVEIARMPLVAVCGEAAAYVLILASMYLLVTRVQRRPDFLAAIHWNWPSKPGRYLLAGFVLSVALQGLARLLPIPKGLPIDSFFQTPAEAWALSIFGLTFAPLLEELYFRGFLYPVLSRRVGVIAGVLLTALPFALLHGAQLGFAWGPVLVIFLVGTVLTAVRDRTDSVASGMLVHVAYNGTLLLLMFVATDGFRHLENFNQ
jgi:membrane protease YdiL (CAAX protease family)